LKKRNGEREKSFFFVISNREFFLKKRESLKMSKRKAQYIEEEASRESADMRSKHKRQSATVPDVDLSGAMARLKLEHETATQNSMAGGPPFKDAAVSLQVPLDPRAEAAERSKHSFVTGQEPHLMKNWCGAGGSSVMNVGDIYTPVRARGGTQPGYMDMASAVEASAWVPMVPAPVQPTPGEVLLVANVLPQGGVLIGSRDGRSAYHIVRGIGGGSYGGIFSAFSVNLANMQDVPNSEVALKLMPINPAMFVAGSQQGQPKRLSPRAINGAFVQYVLQRSYGGCMPYTVCMHNAFMLAVPEVPPRTGVQWHAVIIMEKMDGNVLDLIRSRELLEMKTPERYATVLKLACKMARAVFDLELQRIFHDDIKPQNFLYRKLGPGDYEVKVTDFDLGAFAGRTEGTVDNYRLATEAVKESTRGNFDRDSQAWASVPGVRYLMRAAATTTEFYKPPEYDLVRMVMSGMVGEDITAKLAVSSHMLQMPLPPMAQGAITHVGEFMPFRNKNIYNADWLSRMMAFELVSSIREMFLAAGLSPHYTVDRRYPADIMQPQGTMTHRTATTLIRMAPDGAENIVPPTPAYDSAPRLQEWERLRSHTVHPSYPDQTQVSGLSELNRMLASVMAPRRPDPINKSVHHAMQLVTVSPGNVQTLCADQDNFAVVRPTTGEVLRILLDAAAKGRIINAQNARVNSIPTSVPTSLSADLLMIQ
jgi:serine/threonine protein kinase